MAISAVLNKWFVDRKRELGRKLIFLFCFLLAISLKAQSPDRALRDSMISEIYTATSDSARTRHLNHFTNNKRYMDILRHPQGARSMKEAIFSTTSDSTLRRRAILGLAIAFGSQEQLDSSIHYSIKAAEWFNVGAKARGYTKEGLIVDAMWVMQLQQDWDNIIFWSDSLLKNQQQTDPYDLQNIYLLQQTALAELGDFAGGLESCIAFFKTFDPGHPDYDILRAFAMERLATLEQKNRNFPESRRWLNELMQLAEATQDTFSLTEYKTKLGVIFIEEGEYEKGRRLLKEVLPSLIQTEQQAQEEYARGGDDVYYDPFYDYWPLKGASITARVGLIKSATNENRLIDADIQRDIAYLKKQVDNNAQYESYTIQLDMLGVLSAYYSAVGDHPLAVQYARKGLTVAEENTRDYSPYVESSLRLLHTVENAAGERDKAYQTLLRHQQYSEGLNDQVDASRLVRAQAAIDLDEAERARQIAERATLAEKEAAALRSRNFWIVLMATGLILVIISWAFIRSRKNQKLITVQKMALSQSLSEKEVLLREIHHRVKNNLQIISSLLQKQARVAGDDGAKDFAKQGQERIQSMALVHENLYQSEQLNGVNIKEYLTDLAANIKRGHDGPGTTVGLDLRVANETLDLDTAIPVGLILNELLTNAYKYAFAGRAAGKITVDFGKQGEGYQLQVSDNGVGLPADHAQRRKTSLGHNLVAGLVRQLEGSIEWLGGKPAGTAVKITF